MPDGAIAGTIGAKWRGVGKCLPAGRAITSPAFTRRIFSPHQGVAAMEQPSTKPRRKRSASTPVRDVTEGRAEGALDLELENSALLSPLAYLLRVMRDPNASGARRDRAAVSAAQYVHQRAVETRRTKKSEAARK